MSEAPVDENGVTVINFRREDSYGKQVVFYSAFDTNSLTYIYNEAGESNDDSGEVDLQHIHSSNILQIYIPTLGSASVEVQIEGRGNGFANWSLIYNEVYTSAMSIGDFVNISESVDKIRVGLKVVTPGVDIVYIGGNFKTKTI